MVARIFTSFYCILFVSMQFCYMSRNNYISSNFYLLLYCILFKAFSPFLNYVLSKFSAYYDVANPSAITSTTPLFIAANPFLFLFSRWNKFIRISCSRSSRRSCSPGGAAFYIPGIYTCGGVWVDLDGVEVYHFLYPRGCVSGFGWGWGISPSIYMWGCVSGFGWGWGISLSISQVYIHVGVCEWVWMGLRYIILHCII